MLLCADNLPGNLLDLLLYNIYIYRLIVLSLSFRNLLCFPIHKDDAVIGVAQLCNKKNGLYFDVFDEEVAMGFSVYCGISLMHSLVYKKVKETQARNRLANELMMYHMKVSAEF